MPLASTVPVLLPSAASRTRVPGMVIVTVPMAGLEALPAALTNVPISQPVRLL